MTAGAEAGRIDVVPATPNRWEDVVTVLAGMLAYLDGAGRPRILVRRMLVNAPT